jgi:hypothetical protein
MPDGYCVVTVLRGPSQPTKFELAINPSKALGLQIPDKLLARRRGDQ